MWTKLPENSEECKKRRIAANGPNFWFPDFLSKTFMCFEINDFPLCISHFQHAMNVSCGVHYVENF